MKKIIYILLPALILFFQIQQGFCADTENIRVGISNQSFSNYLYKTIKLSSTSDFEVKDTFSTLKIGDFPANTVLEFKIENNFIKIFKNNVLVSSELVGPIRIIPKSKDGFVYVQNLKRKAKPALYHGSLEIIKSGSKNNFFLVINILNLQDYLKGVVPNEMPVRFGLEALKAQAVAARNYALRPRKDTTYPEFDVCDSTACQVYFGANTQEELSNLAVDMTKGIYALYKEDLILALYHSTSGGVTENYENVFSIKTQQKKEDLPLLYEMYQQAMRPVFTTIFPSRPIPYLKSVADIKETPILKNEEDAKVFILNPPQAFENQSPFYRWKTEWTKEELEAVLGKTLEKNYDNIFVTKKNVAINEFGSLQSIKILQRGASSKIISMQIETDKNIYTVKKELIIRKIFLKDGKMMKSANVIFDLIKDENGKLLSIVANGAGYGHGVGMSQFGAGYMGQTGFSFEQILQHYYKGISLGTLPLEIQSEPDKQTYSQKFYTTSPKATLMIHNRPFQSGDLKVVVNKQEVPVSITVQAKEEIRQDISKYLKNGDNEITVFLPQDNDDTKQMKVWVELYESKHE